MYPARVETPGENSRARCIRLCGTYDAGLTFCGSGPNHRDVLDGWLVSDATLLLTLTRADL